MYRHVSFTLERERNLKISLLRCTGVKYTDASYSAIKFEWLKIREIDEQIDGYAYDNANTANCIIVYTVGTILGSRYNSLKLSMFLQFFIVKCRRENLKTQCTLTRRTF